MATRKATAKKTSSKSPQKEIAQVVVPAPRFSTIKVPIIGSTYFVSNKFSEEAKQMMLAEMEKDEADKAKSRKKNRPKKDVKKEALGSLHIDDKNGKFGLPAMGIKAAMIRACKLVGIEMVTAKMCLDVVADGYNDSGEPIIHITKGKPQAFTSHVKNANNSADIRGRSRFAPGWEAVITVRYDMDFIREEHVINLLQRAGAQVGVGAGRPFSTNSVGMGWGCFEVKSTKRLKELPQAAE